MYEVRFIGRLEQSYGERAEGNRMRIDAVQSVKIAAPTSYLWVDGDQARLAHEEMLKAYGPTEWSGDVDAAIGYTSCSTSQKNALPSALSQALSYATNGSNYLNAGTAGARYTTWFGTYDSSRYSTVKSHFANIKSALGTQPIAFDCSCTESGTYAYVYPTQPYKIYVCGAFWAAPNAGTDSRGGTIVHETSHFDVVANTDDLAYGQTAAKSLARKSPAKAIRNADSHEYFGENTPAQN
jgi:peptidyl-Lys metalloendopeptidase